MRKYMKEYMQEYQKIKKTCDVCNCTVKLHAFSNHIKTKKHQKNLINFNKPTLMKVSNHPLDDDDDEK